MICPKCKEEKNKEDFYWHKLIVGFVPQKRYKECKACVLAQRKEELKEKNDYMKKYFV